jgi:hypothetical protein
VMAGLDILNRLLVAVQHHQAASNVVLKNGILNRLNA